jgi:hypothetical protein
MIAMKEVTSAAMKAWGYAPTSHTLAIRFNTGSVHHYVDVPQDIADGLAAADSVGRFYAANIRGKFPSVAVLEEEPDDAPITTKDGAAVDLAKPWAMPA